MAKTTSKNIAEIRKRKKEEEEVASSNVGRKQTTYNTIQAIKIRDSLDVDSLQRDMSALSETLKNTKGWQNPITMNKTRSAIKSIADRVNSYQIYQKEFGGTDLSDVAIGYKTLLDSWDDRTKTYGKYKSAEEYDNAVKLAKAEIEKRKGMKTANLDEIQAEIDRLKGIEEQAKPYADAANKAIHTRNTSAESLENIRTSREKLEQFYQDNGFANADELAKAISEKSQYKNQAKLVQDSIKLSKDIRKDADYEKYASAGEALGNEKADGWFVPDNQRKNSVAYLRNNPDAMKAYEKASKSANGFSFGTVERQLTEGNLEYKAAKYGTDEQLKDYYAYLGKGDEENALKYLQSIEQSLNEAMSIEIADDKDNIWKQISFSGAAGLDQFEQGTKNLFNFSDDYIPTSPTQLASGQVREKLDEVGFDNVLGLGSSLGQMVYDLGTTTFNMAPSILASSVSNMILPGSGKIVGGVTMGASAAGNAYQEKINQGWDKDQARVYSTAIGISEGALQYALGGISSMGGKLSGESIKAMATGIDKALVRYIATMDIKGMSEGIEESLQEIIAPFIENLALGYAKNDWSDVELAEVAYSGLLGALSAGLLEGGGTAVEVFGENHKAKGIGATVRNAERMSDVFDIASLTPQESDAYNLYTAYAKKGVNAENASDLQLGRLFLNSNKALQEVLGTKKATLAQRDDAIKNLERLSEISKENTLDDDTRNAIKENVEVGREYRDGLISQGLESGENTESYRLATELKAKLENGEEISQKELSRLVKANDNAIKLEEYAQEMSEEDAGLFVEQYDGKMDAEEYLTKFNYINMLADASVDIDEALAKSGSLTPSQVGAIYNARVLSSDVKPLQVALDNLKAKHKNSVFIEGSVNDVVIDYRNGTTDGSKVNWKDLSSTQKKAIRFAKAFAKATGVNIMFTRSKVVNGEHQGENGSYNPDTNTITLDVFAGRIDAKSAKDAIIPTLSHEITHWMEKKAPAIYKAISEEVKATLAKDGKLTWNERIADEKGRIKKKHGEDVSDEYAMNEIVARACEDMLKNSNQARKLLSKLSVEEQQSLVGKIKETFDNLIGWVNELLNYYNSKSTEAITLRAYKDDIKRISKMWDEMLVSAIESNQALQKEGKTGEQLAKVGLQFDAESQSIAPTQFSERTWTGSEYVQNREVAISAITKALGVTKAEAERYVDNINSIARAIADDRARLDYEPNADDNASVLKSNKEYKWTVDMSTLCAKRLLFTGTFDAIQKRLPNTAFNSEDIVALRSMMQERGYEVACGICYVESTRRELGTITADFIERYKLAQKTGKPITRVNSKGKVVELQKTKEQMETTTDKSTDRFYADKNYTPTLAELNTTDIDRVKVEHPLVYEAYLQYMNARGQAKPKLLETRAEYKGEIIKTFNKSAVNARNKAGGLRVQSFSDFEVAHLIDMMQVVLDMSRVGLMSQAYTKVPEFADVFGGTGMKINLSLIAKGTGLDADGNLIFDDVEGINHKEAFRLRDKYSKNVGTILVGKNDAHIIKAMADSRIDYIIPFHKSFWKESLYEALGLEGYEDYTETQNEKPLDADRKIHNFQPSEYWDYTKSGDENAQTYLAMCKEDGRIPKFPQFQGYPGYWKLLIDFKMYDNDGVGSPQEVVKPKFSMDEAMGILNSYQGEHRSYPVAQDVVDDFVKQYESGMQYSDRDSAYMDAVDKGDMVTAQKIVDEVAAESGYTSKVYHGTTGFGFTRVNLSKSDDGISFFATDSLELAETYSGTLGETPLKKGNRYSAENQRRYDSLVASFVDKVNEIAGKDILKTEDLPFERYLNKVKKGKMDSSQVSTEMTKYTDKVIEAIEEHKQLDRESDRTIWELSIELESAIYGMSGKSGNYGLYANTENFFEIDGNGAKWSSIPFDKIPSKTTANTREIVKWAKDNGYTGVLFKNIIDVGYHGTEQRHPANVYAFLNPQEQVKSAEPVTYDAFGRVIPLSKRFDKSKKDIRYSDRMTESVYDKMGETARLEKENARLKKDLARLKERVQIEKKVTGGSYIDGKYTDLVAGHIRKISDSTYNKDKLSEELREFYSYAQENAWGEDTLFAKAYELAENVLTEAKPKTETNDYAKYLLKEIRSKRISLSETQIQEAKNTFGKNYRNAFWGKVIIANNGISLDSQWQEWAEMYPGTFKVDISEGDQITELYNIYDALRDVSETIQEYDAEEQTRWLAEEIINKYWTIPIKFTTADKYEARIKVLNFEHRQAMKEMRDDYEKRLETQGLENRWLAEKDKHELRKSKETEISNQKLADDIYYGRKINKLETEYEVLKDKKRNAIEMYRKIRDRKDAEIARAKELGKERLDEFKESAERKTVVQSILATTTSLNKKLLTNSKDTHIPEALKPVVINLIKAIDFSSKQLLGMERTKKTFRGMPTKADVELEKTFGKTKAMADGSASLKDAVVEAQKMFEDAEKVATDTADGTVDLSLVALDANLKDEISELIKVIDVLEKDIGSGFVLQKMNLEQLKVLKAMVNSINHWATNVDKALAIQHKAGISNLSMQTIEENDVLGERKEYIATIESFKNFFSWSNLLPVNAFKRLGNAAIKVFDSLRDAQDTLAFHEEEITSFTEELFKGKNIQDWRKEVKEFSLKLPNGKTKKVRMPVSYVMSLYCVAKQEDAQRHLFGLDENGNRYDGNGGGMTIKGFKEKLHVSKDTKNTILNEQLVKQITSVLTKEQRDVADKLQNFMNTTGSEWCDTVSMALYGIKKFGIKDYFPITVTPTTIKTLKPQDKRQSVHFFSILNYGFTKSRNPNAKQSIEIGDVFEIFANHMSMMSIYSAYALPIYDMVRWYNFTSKNEEGDEIGVQNSLVTAFGDSATTYISRLISDLNGQHESSRLGFISRIFKNTKIAMVGNSISVALLQPTAYLKAMVKIPTRYLLKSALYVKDFGASKGVKKAKQHCGIALWKSQGNFETDISQNMSTKILHDETIWQKFKRWSLWGAEKMDELTWGVLWNACEFEVRAKRKDLKIGSQEFYEVIGKKLRDVIYETQVVDSPLTRSDLMRSPDTGAKMITMFASEITVAYNMVHEAIVDANLDVKRNGKEGAWKRNGKNIAMTLTAYTLTSAVSQILSTAVQGFRDDEDKEFEDYLKMYVSNFLVDWALIGKIPYIKEALNYAQGYSSSRVDTLWLESASNAIKYWAKAFEGKEGASKKAIDNTLKSLSYLSGLPAYNQYRDFMATLNFLNILDAEDFKEMLDEIFE